MSHKHTWKTIPVDRVPRGVRFVCAQCGVDREELAEMNASEGPAHHGVRPLGRMASK